MAYAIYSQMVQENIMNMYFIGKVMEHEWNYGKMLNTDEAGWRIYRDSTEIFLSS